MRNGFLGSVLALLAGTGIALAQPSFAGNWEQEPPPAKAAPAPSPTVAMAPLLSLVDDEAEAPTRVWASAEYLLWWVKDGSSPVPLVTTAPDGSLAILGQPGTTTVAGVNGFDYDVKSGARLTIGLWLDKAGLIGIEGSGFGLENSSKETSIASDANGAPALSRPVIDALVGNEAVSPISFPGAFTGNAVVSSSNQFWGGEANFVGSVYRACWCYADMIVGFRYFGLDEDVAISTNSNLLGGGLTAFQGMPVRAPATLSIVDRFETRNDFYGGQIGAHAEFHLGRAYVDLRQCVAVGNNHEVITVGGSTTLASSGASIGSVPGGLLALASNSGTVSGDRFTVLPETRLKIGYQFSSHFGAFVGYTFLYWFDVTRPGDQIDRFVNPRQVPTNLSFGMPGGPSSPALPFQHTDFWAQGVSFGLEFRY